MAYFSKISFRTVFAFQQVLNRKLGTKISFYTVFTLFSSNRKLGTNAPSLAAAHPTKQPTPRFELEGNKWFIEHQTGNRSLVVSDTAMKQVVYVYKCTDCIVQVKGKVRKSNCRFQDGRIREKIN